MKERLHTVKFRLYELFKISIGIKRKGWGWQKRGRKSFPGCLELQIFGAWNFESRSGFWGED